MRKFSNKGCSENQNIHFIYTNVFQKSCLLCDVEKYGRARQPTHDRHLRTACWITTATDKHSEYEILFRFPSAKKKCSTNAPQCLVYTYIACLVLRIVLRPLQGSPCICCGNAWYCLLNNFFMVLAKQFCVTAWYTKHSHLAASSRSTEPRSLDRMQLHGWKLFCVRFS
jgi:hypothetical protein